MKETMLATVLAFATLFSAVRAQPKHKHDPGEKVGGEAYSPGLGEIMALQQMRHSKLWFAGDARNWGLAGYELDELKEGFEGAAKLFPTVNGVSVGQAIGGILADEIPQIASAISALWGARARPTITLSAATGPHTQEQRGAAIPRPRQVTLPSP